MKWLILFILIASRLAAYELSGDLPVLYEGRVRPLAAAEEKGALFLPGLHEGEWLPLEILKKSGKNPTPYPDSLFRSIRESYLKQDWTRLDSGLKEGYKMLEGKNMLQAAGKSLVYPSLMRVKVELWLVSYPFLLMLICGYAATVLLLFFSPRAGSWIFLSVDRKSVV